MSGPRLIRTAATEVLHADPWGTVGAGLFQVLGALAALGTVVAAKLAFDAVLRPDDARFGLAPVLLLLAMMTALSASVGALQAQQMRILSERVAQRVWHRVIDATCRVPLVAYERTGYSSQLERVLQNGLDRPYNVTTALLGLLGSVLGVVTMTGVLVSIEPLLVPVLLAAGIPAILLSRRASRAEYRFATQVTALIWRRSYLRDLLTRRPSAAELRAFDYADRLRHQHAALDEDWLRALRKQVRIRQAIAVLSTLGVGLALAAALLAIVELVARGRIDLAEAGAAAIAVRLLSSQLGSVFGSIGGLQEAVPFLADLERFLALAPPPAARGRKRPLTEGVALRGVSFSYPDQARPAVQDVDLEIHSGEVVALVGENGSGKTTLAMIAAGLFEPTRGSVVWDGEVAVPMADIRASVSVILQDFVHYQMTVRDNAVISDPSREPSDGEVRRICARAGVLPAVDAMVEGLDTVLGRDMDEGVDLSGGQWQRLALARALYRDTPLVVLDEPTAALDPRAEHELFSDVRRVLGGRAALLISHRFSSVRLADRIYVLDGGRVVESGTHDELMARAGQYAELFALQSEAYR